MVNQKELTEVVLLHHIQLHMDTNNLKEYIKLLKKEIFQVSGLVSVNLKIKKSDILDISKTDQRRENES